MVVTLDPRRSQFVLFLAVNIIECPDYLLGHAVAQLVEALRYKPEGRGFDPDYVIGIFHGHNRFGRTAALGSTQPLTEMSTRNVSWGVKAAGA
jgi:hypothetical protein